MKPLLDVLMILDALEKEGSFAAASAKLYKTPSASWKATLIFNCLIVAVTALNSPAPEKCY